jgi:hypothetical protein
MDSDDSNDGIGGSEDVSFGRLLGVVEPECMRRMSYAPGAVPPVVAALVAEAQADRDRQQSGGAALGRGGKSATAVVSAVPGRGADIVMDAANGVSFPPLCVQSPPCHCCGTIRVLLDVRTTG